MKLCIDPGHGGQDPGTTAHGLKEKDLTLNISLYMAQRAQELGMEVFLTRSGDLSLTPNERVQKVLSSKADLCISNHINAGGGKGAEIIHSLYSDGKLAKMILDNIKNTGMPVRRVYYRASTSQPGKDYYFLQRLTYPQIPETLIIEYGFIDNEADRARLINPEIQKQLVEAVLKAVAAYTQINYTEPKAFAVEVIDRKGKSHRLPQDFVKLENGVTWVKARNFTELAGGLASYDKVQNKSTFDFSDGSIS